MTDIASEILEPSGIPSSEQNEQSSPRGGDSFAWPASTGAVSTPLKSGFHRASHPAADGLHSACSHDPRHAATQGTNQLLWRLAAYLAIHIAEGNFIAPLIQRQTAIPGEQR
jgi:hypothetical protein